MRSRRENEVIRYCEIGNERGGQGGEPKPEPRIEKPKREEKAAPEKPKKKRGRGARNAAIIILCVFALLVGGVYYTINHYYSKLNFGYAAEDASGKKVQDMVNAASLEQETGRSYTGKKVTNILLIGVDVRPLLLREREPLER